MALHALRLNHNYLTRDGELIVLVLVYIRCTTLCWKNMPQLLVLLFQHVTISASRRALVEFYPLERKPSITESREREGQEGKEPSCPPHRHTPCFSGNKEQGKRERRSLLAREGGAAISRREQRAVLCK